MLQQSNSILRLCIVVVVVMLVQLSFLYSQAQSSNNLNHLSAVYDLLPCTSQLISTGSGRVINVNFINKSNQKLKLFWMNYSGKSILYKELKPYLSFKQISYEGHIWKIENLNRECMGIYKLNRENGDIIFELNSNQVSKVDNISEKINNTILQNNNTVTIGNQVWTSKNLDVSTFRNGEVIPEAKSKEEWVKAGNNKTAAYCHYDYDSKNGKVYGKLYNWYAVNDSRGLAPNGYHIPSDSEWTVLTNFLGGEEIAGEKMKSKQGWRKNDKKSGNGDNSSGFNGLAGGYCESDGYFYDITVYGGWWSSSEGDMGFAWSRSLYFYNSKVGGGSSYEDFGLSVRCLRD